MQRGVVSVVSILLLATVLGLTSCAEEDPEVCSLIRVEEKKSYPPTSQFSGYTYVTEYSQSGSHLIDLKVYDASTPDDKQTLSFSYDSQNRLVKGEDIANDVYLIFGYDNQNNMIELTHYVRGAVVELSSYEYNTSGQLVRVSYFSLRLAVMSLALTVTYEYPNEKTKNFHTKKYYYPQDAEALYVSSFEWDSKKSPYEQHPYFFRFDKGESNVTKQTTTYGSSISDELSYVYTYNSNGYPITRTLTGDAQPDFFEEITYAYSCKK